MKFQSLLFLAFSSAYAAVFNPKGLVMTTGLQNENFDRRVAVVVGDAVVDSSQQARYPVIMWMGLNSQPQFSPIKHIKPENLYCFDHHDCNMPKSRQREFIDDFRAKFPTAYEGESFNAYKISCLDQFATLIQDLSNLFPDNLLKDDIVKFKGP